MPLVSEPTTHAGKLAARVRSALKEEYPDTRFSVRGTNEWQGRRSGVTVRWVDGPSAVEVKRLCAGRLDGGRLTTWREPSPEAVAQVAVESVREVGRRLHVPDGHALGRLFEELDAEGAEPSERALLLAQLVRVHLDWYPPRSPRRGAEPSGNALVWRTSKVYAELVNDPDEVLEVMVQLTRERGSALHWKQFGELARAAVA